MKARIKRKNINYKRLEQENEKYKAIIESLQSKIKNDEFLEEQNEKLIDWVQKILDQFGTLEVRDRNRIQIPVMRKVDNWSNGIDNGIFTTETILIPEIVINKTSYRR